jgi:hypothetical protein
MMTSMALLEVETGSKATWATPQSQEYEHAKTQDLIQEFADHYNETVRPNFLATPLVSGKIINGKNPIEI